MAIYVFIKPVNSTDDFQHVLMTNNEGAIRDYSAPISNFIAEMSKWVVATRKGRVITNVNGVFGVVLDDPMLISDIKAQLDKWRVSVPLCVGVSAEIFDAYKAMVYSEANVSDSMVFYDAEVEKAFNDHFEDELFKAEDQKPAANNYEFDLPQLELDKEKGEEEKKASGASKKKILDILMELKEKAPVIAQLKQLDPSAFKAISKLVEALGAIAAEGLLKSEALKKDLMPGGKGDDKPDDNFDPEALAHGTKIEMEEHGLDEARAKEVAKDHLTEDPNYYKLEKLHEWKKPDGWVQDGKKIVADDRDLNTGAKLPRIIRQGHAGVKMGPNGGAVGATKTPRER